MEEAKRGLNGHYMPKNMGIFTTEEKEIINTHTIVFVPGKVKCFYADVVFENQYRAVLGGLNDEENRARAGVT